MRNHVSSVFGKLRVADRATTELRRQLSFTHQEFELLRFLAQNRGRVFTREALLNQVWGYDYYGGTRTVDVHVRRLRAKLGSEYESMIGTVRQVGYKFVVQSGRALPDNGPLSSLLTTPNKISADA